MSNFDKISISREQLQLGARRERRGSGRAHGVQALDDSELEVKLHHCRPEEIWDEDVHVAMI